MRKLLLLVSLVVVILLSACQSSSGTTTEMENTDAEHNKPIVFLEPVEDYFITYDSNLKYSQYDQTFVFISDTDFEDIEIIEFNSYFTFDSILIDKQQVKYNYAGQLKDGYLYAVNVTSIDAKQLDFSQMKVRFDDNEFNFFFDKEVKITHPPIMEKNPQTFELIYEVHEFTNHVNTNLKIMFTLTEDDPIEINGVSINIDNFLLESTRASIYNQFSKDKTSVHVTNVVGETLVSTLSRSLGITVHYSINGKSYSIRQFINVYDSQFIDDEIFVNQFILGHMNEI